MSLTPQNFYVYIYFDQNNIPFYVGKGKNSRYYICKHLYKNCSNRLLKNKIYVIGVKNIKIKFLYTDLTEEEANEREEYWISYYGRRDLNRGPLCNLTNGGEGVSGQNRSGENNGMFGKHLSEETKKKLSAAHKGKTAWNKGRPGMKGETHPFFGKHHSKETTQKISQSLIGYKHTEETRKKLSLVTSGERNGFYGKRHSKETIQKIRESKFNQRGVIT